MQETTSKPRNRLKARIIHAFSYELILLTIGAPILAYIFRQPLQHSGALWLMMSGLALLWNMLFNSIFEQLERYFELKRTVFVRIVHAIGFEGGLLIFTVPLIMWQMNLNFRAALLLDIVMALGIMGYTFIFQWVYDVITARSMRPQR